MDSPILFCGREFSTEELKLVREVVTRHAGLSRMELAFTVCELLQWERKSGGLKSRECRDFLELLDNKGLLDLPQKRKTKPVGTRTTVPITADGEPGTSLEGKVGDFEPIVLETVQSKQQRLLFRELIGRYHYLGYSVPFGANLRYFISSGSRVLGCMQFSSPAWRMAARDQWIGWSDRERQDNLQRVVNQSRFLILPWVNIANLASVVLSRVLHRLSQDWEAIYNIEPLLVETLVDESRYSGHCYKASNWERLGLTTGRGRMDREHKLVGAQPKAIWIFPLKQDAAQRLRGQA